MKEQSLIGKTVVYYEPYARNLTDTAKQATITKEGRKYIHVGTLQFDKESLRCTTLNYGLYLGSLEEFKEAIKLQKSILLLLDKLKKKVDIDVPLPFLRMLEAKLAEILK